MPACRKHLSSGHSGRAGWKGLACVGLTMMLAGCASTVAIKTSWTAEDFAVALPEQAPFSLLCGEVEIIVMADGGSDQYDFSNSYAWGIKQNPILNLSYDGSDRAVLKTVDGRSSFWIPSWSPPTNGGIPATRIYFSPIEGDGFIELKLDTVARVSKPLVSFTYSIWDDKGTFSIVRKISEDLNCMRVSDIEMRINP